MDWKNQLTKTPYLVLFIVLISIGVGTASALITITLSGNVVITDNLEVGGSSDVLGSATIADDLQVHNDLFVNGELEVGDDLIVGASAENDDDFIRFDAGNENIQWDESQTRFRLSDSLVTGGHFAAGSISADDTVNRFGDGTPTAPESMTGFGDLYLADDLEVTSDLYVGGTVNCPTCPLGFYQKQSSFSSFVNGKLLVEIDCDPEDEPINGGFDLRGNDHPDGRIEVIRLVTEGIQFGADGLVEGKFVSFEVKCADFPPAHVEE